jgi:Fe-S-cluster-containing dehydrogenase component
MIDLGTLAGLLEHHHRLDAYCSRCDRWAELDLAAMVAAGRGSRRLPIRVTCSACASPGQLQVCPPGATWGPGARMQPR